MGSVGFPAFRTTSAETATAFLTWTPLVSFSGLVSSTVWDMSGKSKPPCLIPGLGGSIQPFANKNDAGCGFL